MKFKVGDKVRIFGKGEVEKIIDINKVFGYRLNCGANYYIEEELELVTNDYITTKDFIKEVEKFGYKVSVRNNKSMYMQKPGGNIYLDTDKVISFNCRRLILTSEELDLVVRYIKTPIEYREEPKKYTLQCPLTKWYLFINLHGFKYAWQNCDSSTKLTQEEIDNLPNQDIIKQLIKEKVE